MYELINTPITAKLMVLRVGCYNFRSVGVFSKKQPYHIVDYTDINNQFVGATGNGQGKSSLQKHLLDYCLTGGNSVENDVLDALINSANKKQGMSTFIEVHCNGEFYKSVRGRGKMKAFDIFKLVNGEWEEIPNLPVSDRDRQSVWYSLLGLDKNTAEVIISNTISLGIERFKGLLSMKADERRKLLEPIFGVTVFSDMNKEAKSRRASTTIEQKQVLLEITALDTKVALAEQSVEYTKKEQHTLEADREAKLEVLADKVNKCTAEYENALQLDTGGSELHIKFEEDSLSLAESKVVLTKKLESDLESLGEFKIDPEDKVLTKLHSDLYVIDQEIELAENDLQEKQDGLGEEIATTVSDIKERLNSCKIDNTEKLTSLEKTFVKDENNLKDLIETESNALTLLIARQAGYVAAELEARNVYESLQKNYEEAVAKELKYKTNIDKLKDARVFVSNKIAIEESNLQGLSHAGQCPSCKQHISEDYISQCKTEINAKLLELREEFDLYNHRVTKGEEAIIGLSLSSLKNSLNSSFADLQQAKLLCENNNVQTKELRVNRLQTELGNLVNGYAQDKLKIESEYERITNSLNSKLNSVEYDVAKTLGKYQANLDQLVANKPSREANLLQQIKDREEALKGEFGGKERNLQKVYEVECKSLDDKLKSLESNLHRDLDGLIKDKGLKVMQTGLALKQATEDETTEIENYTRKVEKLEAKLFSEEANLSKLVYKLEEFNALHNKLEQDIVDYNHLLQLISDDEGKAEVLKNFMPEFNRDINRYLGDMELFLDVTVNEKFDITMSTENRDGQTINSLSVGQKCRINLSIILALRDMSTRLSGVDCNVLILDEVLSGFHEDEVPLVIELLKHKFTDKSLIVIGQNKSSYSEHFDKTVIYSLVNGFTREVDID